MYKTNKNILLINIQQSLKNEQDQFKSERCKVMMQSQQGNQSIKVNIFKKKLIQSSVLNIYQIVRNGSGP